MHNVHEALGSSLRNASHSYNSNKISRNRMQYLQNLKILEVNINIENHDTLSNATVIIKKWRDIFYNAKS